MDPRAPRMMRTSQGRATMPLSPVTDPNRPDVTARELYSQKLSHAATPRPIHRERGHNVGSGKRLRRVRAARDGDRPVREGCKSFRGSAGALEKAARAGRGVGSGETASGGEANGGGVSLETDPAPVRSHAARGLAASTLAGRHFFSATFFSGSFFSGSFFSSLSFSGLDTRLCTKR